MEELLAHLDTEESGVQVVLVFRADTEEEREGLVEMVFQALLQSESEEVEALDTEVEAVDTQIILEGLHLEEQVVVMQIPSLQAIHHTHQPQP